MGNVYIRGDKERRIAHLGIIDQEKKVQFIDEALSAELTRREKEREQKLREKYELIGEKYEALEKETEE